MSKKSKIKVPKMYRKSVSVINSKFLDRDLQSKTSKFKRTIAKLFRIPIIDEYLYSFNIQYQGRTRLKENDTIVNQQGIHFLVYKESNRQAIIVSANKSACQPFALGRFTIIDIDAEIKHQELVLKMQEERAKEKENKSKSTNQK